MLSCSYFTKDKKFSASIDVLNKHIEFKTFNEKGKMVKNELYDLDKLGMDGLTSNLLYLDKDLTAAYDATSIAIFDEKIIQFTREYTHIIGMGRYKDGFYVAYRASGEVKIRTLRNRDEDSKVISIPHSGVKVCYGDDVFYVLAEVEDMDHSHRLILVKDREVKRVIPLHIGDVDCRDYQLIVRGETVFLSFIAALDNEEGVYSGFMDLNNVGMVGFLRSIVRRDISGLLRLTGMDYEDGYVKHFTMVETRDEGDKYLPLSFSISMYSLIENREDPMNHGSSITEV